MSTQNLSNSKSFRRSSSALIAILTVLFLAVAPTAMARPADPGPSIDTSIVFELIQDLFGELGAFFVNSTTEGNGNAETTSAQDTEPVTESDDDQPVAERGPTLDPFG